MSYLVDTDWLIDVLFGVPRAVTVLERLSDQDLGVSIVSYGELFEGAWGSPNPHETLMRYRAFLERFARVRRELRRQGQLIPDLDLLIAATALTHDLTLVTRNLRHFERIPELTLYQPS